MQKDLSLKLLNSEPVVVLQKIEGFDENSKRDVMQRSHEIVKQSPNSSPISSSITLKINRTDGMLTCHKKKSSLEDNLTEVDTAYETQKKQKKEEDFELNLKTSGTGCSSGGLSSSESKNKRSLKKDKKHNKMKRKSNQELKDHSTAVSQLADSSESTPEQILSVKICCISINVSTDQLEQQESNFRQEQVVLQATLSETKVKHQGLSKELDILASKLRDLEQESTNQNGSIATDGPVVEKLSADVNESREDRNRLLAEKEKIRRLVLQTEMKLRTLQLELCRQKLEVDSEVEFIETHPMFNAIRDNEKLVVDIRNERMTKSATFTETDAAYQRAEKFFQQKNEMYEVAAKRLDEARKKYQKLLEHLKKLKSEIATVKQKMMSIKEERKKACLRLIDVESKLIKIETCKKLKVIEQKRQDFIAAEDD